MDIPLNPIKPPFSYGFPIFLWFFKEKSVFPSEIASRRHRLHLPGASASGASAARPQGAAQEAQAAAGPRLQRAVGEGPVHGDLAWSSWRTTVMAIKTSYNWWFLWDNKHSINGVLLVLKLINGHNCNKVIFIWKMMNHHNYGKSWRIYKNGSLYRIIIMENHGGSFFSQIQKRLKPEHRCYKHI